MGPSSMLSQQSFSSMAEKYKEPKGRLAKRAIKHQAYIYFEKISQETNIKHKWAF